MTLEDRLHKKLALYMRAPNWLRGVVGHAYRAVPSRVRFGPRYAEFLTDARQAEGAVPWSQVAQRLDATLRAAAEVPAHGEYAGLLRDSRRDVLDRLRALPVMCKADLKANLASHLRAGSNRSDRLPMFTGGSTAQPMQFYLHRHVSRPKESAYFHHIERGLLGTCATDWALSLRGRTVLSAARPAGRLWATEPIKRHLLFSADHLEAGYMPQYVQALQRLRPRVIHAFPSALYPLSRWLLDHPAPSFTDEVTGVLLTSENAYDFQLGLFQQIFPKAKIIRHYGHSERVLMAVATARHAPMVFFSLYGLPELVDAQGRVIDRPGVLGEIVGTSFDNHVMPFVRYRTGDMGLWVEAPSYDGEARFTMQRIEGRCQEFVVCADRRLISITTLGAAHFAEISQADWIQFEQRVPGRITLKLVKPDGLSLGERKSIAAAVADKTQGGCEVDIQTVPSIERTARGKHRMLIQHLDISSFLGASITPQREERLLSETSEWLELA